MALHLYCPTPRAILLLGFVNEQDILVFPSQSTVVPGLHFENKPLVPINDQIVQCVEQYCQRKDLAPRLYIDQEFAETIVLESGEATLYLAMMRDYNETLPRYLHTLPFLLRGMPKERKRLSYLKAFQVLSGAREQSIRAVESSIPH